MARTLNLLLALTLWAAPALAQDAEGPKPVSPEELEQLVAPIALYPDSVVSQILMASSYPLEVVEADRWVKAQKPPLTGDALAKALEEQSWDPSVKSLIAFPDVLTQMSTKLDWTVKLGDAVLASEKDVLDATQRLRHRAQEAGNLESGAEQMVTTDGDVIIIEPTKTEIIYIPTYNPTVVYGTWPYPAYPPTYYYPSYYVYPPAPHAFATGVAIGLAWGYAWGGCGWHSGHVDIDINRNININKNIDRNRYSAGTGGKGNWKHDPKGRKGVRYSDSATAKKYGKQSNLSSRSKSRESYRGRGTSSSARSTAGNRTSGSKPSSSSRKASPKRSSPKTSGSAFKNYQGRSQTTRQSSRGRSSRGSMSSAGRRGGGGRRGR